MILLYNFDVKEAAEQCSEWIKNWFLRNGNGCNAVIGISGGKDSSVTAALCVKALSKERVIGVMMPCGIQEDIDYSKDLCSFLNIKNYTVNIKNAVDSVLSELDGKFAVSTDTKMNLPARLRMACLYAVSQSNNGRVVNTCNLSEDYVGYSTRYGDSVGDLSPLSHFTVTEVKQIGRYLGLPEKFIEKTPIDGLCGKSDEEKLGFTYDTLDKYIRENIVPEKEIKDKIDRLHKLNLFKLELMESFDFFK